MAAILLPLAQGFEEVEAVSLIDVLRRGGLAVRIATVDPHKDDNLVLGANGITIQADTNIKNVVADDFDMILLPGGWENTYTLAENETVQNLLKEFKFKDKVVGSICAAAYALKKADVLAMTTPVTLQQPMKLTMKVIVMTKLWLLMEIL